ncbi:MULTISPECIES: aminoimidazole riboside kinase [unclassified Vibrio]|uniref:Aminoimidazole riboside kinase n=1 Tax=Vibrio sp. HB236076 TaxID=3232307 RepID=A0AB39HI31_9VIBR|nr:aminoimidazole riboside kinase [Vibrio sp. HB161653]MDP5255517.1 aminoimidazole riboside kinase [Vibrio sp. HB161653]
MNKVWLTGDAVVDLIADGEKHYLKCPGGAPANVAVAIARLCGKAIFLGKIGNDPIGRLMKKTLKEENVNTEYLYTSEYHRTSTVIVDLDDHGERSFTFMVKPSADQFLCSQEIPEFSTNQWLHGCSIALAHEPSRSATLLAMEKIKQVHGYVSFDPNLRPEVWSDTQDLIPTVMQAIALADVVKLSKEELLYLTSTQTLDDALSILEPINIPLILITQAEQGTLVITNKTRWQQPSIKVTPIDTTGAGDAFVGGVLARLSQSNNWQTTSIIRQAVQWGNICGALATTKKGAMTALPTAQQLKENLLQLND